MTAPDIISVLKDVGKFAGIGGIAVAAFTSVVSGIVGVKKLFPMLTKEQAYKLLVLIVVSCLAVAVCGFVSYAYGHYLDNLHPVPAQIPTPSQEPAPTSITTPNSPPALTPTRLPAKATCVQGDWVEVNDRLTHGKPFTWNLGLTKDQPPKLKARRDDGNVFYYEYDRRQDKWVADTVIVPVKLRDGKIKYDERKATLEVRDEAENCSILATDRSAIHFKRGNHTSHPKSTLSPEGCVRSKGKRCIEYSFPVILHGQERKSQTFRLTGLHKGDNIRARFEGTVLPDAADAAGNGTAADITVLIRPVGGQCPQGAACMGHHPYPGTERNYPPLKAIYDMVASSDEQRFEIEINFCSYEGKHQATCLTEDDARVSFKIR